MTSEGQNRLYLLKTKRVSIIKTSSSHRAVEYCFYHLKSGIKSNLS